MPRAPIEMRIRRLAAALYSLVAACWVGSQIAIGYIAAPVLFSQLADRTLAGALAGTMFAVMAWVSLGCGLFLLLTLVLTRGREAFRSVEFGCIALMLALTVLGHFGVGPLLAGLKAEALPLPVMESPLRERFALWHGVSSVLYLLQSLTGLALVLVARASRHDLD